MFNQNLEKIKEYEEYELFFLLDECNSNINISNEVLKINDSMNKDEKDIFIENIAKIRNIRKNVINEIEKRFNFKHLDNKSNPTKEYLNWFNSWVEWRNSFSEEQWNEIIEKLKNKESIKKYI